MSNYKIKIQEITEFQNHKKAPSAHFTLRTFVHPEEIAELKKKSLSSIPLGARK